MIGITSYGAYVPRLRLNRMAIVQNMGWFAPAIMMVAQGERSMCNWDEDALTMAVAASRDCLKGADKQAVEAVHLASTTLPFADRQNAGVVAAALNLPRALMTADHTASQKAATTALITALESVGSGARHSVLVAAADRRETRTAYFYEMWFGDGAAALTVGDSGVIAEYLGAHSLAMDFVDHYRGAANRFDYVWEERWTRDAGYGVIIPQVVKGLFEKLKIGIKDVDKLVFPCFFKADHRKIAEGLGAGADKLVDNLHEVCGETGTAHPLLMLVSALETARPGDRILVCGFGQGANALYFRVTEEILRLAPRKGLSGALANKKSIDNYQKWLKFRDLIQTEMGIRAEAPTQTATTVLWRKNQMLLGLVGGKCRDCGTAQFPKMDICVNPACGALRTQDDLEFADQPATVKTFTGDLLAISVDPPAIYGMVQFVAGGRMMADFTDCELDEIRVGLPVSMEFKRKAADAERGFVNYFWKAVPVPGAAAQADRLNFEGRVAVVTGAGAGLGRVYALELARRGAKVVVNDLGGARDGAGAGSSSAADRVVAEIRAAGGEAVASYASVATAEGGAAIVAAAREAYGRVDILINNAGILRDKSFAKMEPENWQAVMDVHLNGAYHVTRPAMAAMRENGFGRIVMTTSAAGLYGNFGQTNYSAAKMALVGMMNALKLEGQKYDIKLNTVAPIAASRLTEDVMPPELLERSRPELVAPLVLALCSAECPVSGGVFNAGLGCFNRAAVVTGPAVRIGAPGRAPTPEDVHAAWKRVDALEGAVEFAEANAAIMALISPPAPGAPAPDRKPTPAPGAEADTAAVAEVFERMRGRFDPKAAADLSVVFQFVISGAGGGDWHCAIEAGACTIAAGRHARPACTLKMAAADFIALMQGALPAMQAYTSGKLAIEGDVMKSQLLEKLFGMNRMKG
jgi:3-hydroxy-3-methylglutaryl CoA synthase/NAD(P)-dependent dehydrogenase (short-subunit alcohol dehydrogenase family)/putative sterol carrier protein